MTDAILNATLLAVLAACVAVGLVQRLRQLKAERRRKPGAIRGVNRFRSARNVQDLSSLN